MKIKYIHKTRLNIFFQCLLVLAFILVNYTLKAADECVLACRQNVHVSLGNDCNVTVTPDLVLQAPDVTCPGDKIIEVYTLDGVYIDSSPFVSSDYLDDTLDVKITDVASQNFCWASIILSDNSDPVLISCPDITLNCSIDDLTPGTPGIDWPIVTDNCNTNVIFSYTDVFTDLSCDDPVYGNQYSGYYTRSWTAEDDSGNTLEFDQTIFLIRNQLEDVDYPLNYDGFGLPPLNCVNADTSIANTGVPTIDGSPITAFCEMSIVYDDQIVALCGGGYKVYRTWEVSEWCDNDINYHVQVILVEDNVPPTVECTTDTLSMIAQNVVDCLGEIVVPNLIVSGGCSNTYTYAVTIDNGSDIFEVDSLITGVSIGLHVLHYTISNDCGNLSTCDKTIDVEETTPPLAVCADIDIVYLSDLGQTQLTATELDGGSSDDCGIDNIKIRKTEISNCNADTSYQDVVSFDCCESSTFIELELKVTDLYGNMATCTHLVYVYDTLMPVLTCPADLTINCSQDPTDLNLVGVATATDNCSVTNLQYLDISTDINVCGSGYIERLWTIMDLSGNADSCIQMITIENLTPFDENDIIWPQDYMTEMCGTSLAVENFNYPYIPLVSQGDCDDTSISSEDVILYYNYEGDMSIKRTWTVTSNCSGQGNPSSWSHDQILTIEDVEAPTFVCPTNQTYGNINADCDAVFVEVNNLQVMDCDTNLVFTYEIDYNNDQTIDLVVSSPELAVWMPLGIHKITLTVADSKNNTTTCTWLATCRDMVLPTAISISSLTMDMSERDADGILRIYSYMFDNGSYDNCTPFEEMYKLIFPSSFTCDDIGDNEVSYTVIDAAGNLDQTTTQFIITDVDNICNLEKELMGDCRSPMDEGVSDVNIDINGLSVMSNDTGYYDYFYFDIPSELTITPTKTNEVRSGVNTFDLVKIGRQILETEAFDNPYQFVAADVNNSNSVTGADVVILRQLLLYNIDSLPNVDAWRFISEDFVFPPFTVIIPDFPESVTVENPSNPLNVENFVSIKMGDVDFSYENNMAAPLDSREQKTITLNVKKNNEGLYEVYNKEAFDLASFQWTIDNNLDAYLVPNTPLEGVFTDSKQAHRYTSIYYNPLGDDLESETFMFSLSIDPIQYLEEQKMEWFDEEGESYNIRWAYEEGQQSTEIKVYPTIVDAFINIELEELSKGAFVQIYNEKGQLVLWKKISKSTELNLGDLYNGVYFVHIKEDHKTVWTTKIIKQ